jgi:hypothetical protein
MIDEDRNNRRSLLNQRHVDDDTMLPKNKRGSTSSIPMSIDLLLDDSEGDDSNSSQRIHERRMSQLSTASHGEKQDRRGNSQPDRSQNPGKKSRRRMSQLSLGSGLEMDEQDRKEQPRNAVSSKPHPPAAYKDRLRQARQLIAQRSMSNAGQSQSSDSRQSRHGKEPERA